MAGTYEIFERVPNGTLAFVEKADGLETAKTRFFCLSVSSQREYLVWDPARGCEVILKVTATA
jgi:hypothetical protein